MAELIARDTTTTTGASTATTSGTATGSTIAPTTSTTPQAESTVPSPIEELVQNSTTEYSRPPETQPSIPTTVQVAMSKPTSTTISEKPEPEKPPVDTRPLIINTLMVDPISGAATALTPAGNFGTGGGGGGFGGAEPAQEKSAGVVQKKSWMPILLIAIGTVILIRKFTKKKQTA